MPRCDTPAAVEPQVASVGRGHLVWIADEWRPRPEWFDPAWYRAEGLDRGQASGRGLATFGELAGTPVVLRHYRRGGAMRDRLGDRYLWCGLRATRAWRELVLLARLHEAALPVPAPVAARVQRLPGASPWYRADLLSERLPDTRTLAQALTVEALPNQSWAQLGRTLARFHGHGVEHADLNAHNILLGADGSVHLIDFDRGRLRARTGHWCQRNVDRLHRSLVKLAGLEPAFHFDAAGWTALRAAWQEALYATR